MFVDVLFLAHALHTHLKGCQSWHDLNVNFKITEDIKSH